MSKVIPLSVPSINGNEWKYIKECLDTEWVSSAGKYVDLFEEKVAEYTGAKHAIACVNGTAALQVSLRLAGVEPGHEVIAPTLTFIAPINAISYIGASPVFMDADEYYNIDSEKTIRFIKNETEFRDGNTFNRKTGKRISAIVPVHIWGNACWLDELFEICTNRNITIVEDASESLGTVYSSGIFKGKHTGTIGRLGCISFNGNKIITAGGGGMILTEDDALAHKAKYLTTQAKDDAVRYVHNKIGYNFRLTNIQAALGVAQLEQLNIIIEKKKHIYNKYKDLFASHDGLSLSEVPGYAINNHWLNVLQIDETSSIETPETIMNKLKDKKIQSRPVWYLNSMQIPYKNHQTFEITNAKRLVKLSLCIPSSYSLNIDEIIELLKIATSHV
jgi:perosamine synthetase